MALTARITSIRPIGSSVYVVSLSRSKGEATAPKFNVNLRSLSWNGSCDCDTFTQCCEPLIRLGSKKRWRCDHILAAREWFMEFEAPRIIDTPRRFRKCKTDSKIIILDEHENSIPAAGL